MDLPEVALMVGRIEQKVDRLSEQMTEHLATQSSQESRLKEVEKFQGRAKTIATVLSTFGAGLWSVIACKWIR